MADIVTREVRSRMMSGIRGKNTKPEIAIRHCLHKKGLPGNPDIVFAQYKAVILVNGCFWHGHDCYLFKWPSSRAEFWKTKIEGNKLKDTETLNKLKELGWKVLVIWECAIKGKNKWPMNRIIDVTTDWLVRGNGFYEIRGTNVN